MARFSVSEKKMEFVENGKSYGSTSPLGPILGKTGLRSEDIAVKIKSKTVEVCVPPEELTRTG